MTWQLPSKDLWTGPRVTPFQHVTVVVTYGMCQMYPNVKSTKRESYLYSEQIMRCNFGWWWPSKISIGYASIAGPIGILLAHCMWNQRLVAVFFSTGLFWILLQTFNPFIEHFWFHFFEQLCSMCIFLLLFSRPSFFVAVCFLGSWVLSGSFGPLQMSQWQDCQVQCEHRGTPCIGKSVAKL